MRRDLTLCVRSALRACRGAPAWVAFNKNVGSDGTVGIFHETYTVGGGAHETIYANMPPFGLGKVAGLVPATNSRNAARSRMRLGTDAG